jgi:hypothetical protein
MRIPLKFEHLTLKQFQELHGINTMDKGSLDYKVAKLSILSNKPIEYIEALDIKDFNKYLALTSFTEYPPKNLKVVNRFLVGTTILTPTTLLNEMSVNQLVDFYTILKQSENNYIECAHDLLAIMFKPFNLIGSSTYNPINHSKISKLLLSAKVGDCLGLLFFYSRFWKKCEPIIASCLMEANKTIQEVVEEIMSDKEFQNFLATGDGNTTSIYAGKTLA